MEAIVADGLAGNGYSFQATLSNGSRPDCLIHMPNGGPALAIDAKFPLEAWQRLNEAENPDALRQAMTAFRNDIGVHVRAISEKYLLSGETQDTAFMFVPSESIFADLHERFEDVVQRASRVVELERSQTERLGEPEAHRMRLLRLGRDRGPRAVELLRPARARERLQRVEGEAAHVRLQHPERGRAGDVGDPGAGGNAGRNVRNRVIGDANQDQAGIRLHADAPLAQAGGDG